MPDINDILKKWAIIVNEKRLHGHVENVNQIIHNQTTVGHACMTTNNKVPRLELQQQVHMKYNESYFIFIQSNLPCLQHFHVVV
jgi:hypothetical protein